MASESSRIQILQLVAAYCGAAGNASPAADTVPALVSACQQVARSSSKADQLLGSQPSQQAQVRPVLAVLIEGSCMGSTAAAALQPCAPKQHHVLAFMHRPTRFMLACSRLLSCCIKLTSDGAYCKVPHNAMHTLRTAL